MVSSSIGLQCAWLCFHVRVVDVVASMEMLFGAEPSRKSSSSPFPEIKSSHLPGGRAPSRKFHFPNPSYVRFYVSFRGGFFVERFWANQSSYEIAETWMFQGSWERTSLTKVFHVEWPTDGKWSIKNLPKKRDVIKQQRFTKQQRLCSKNITK